MPPRTAPRSLPHLKTPLPGPKARACLERDAQFVSPSYTRSYPFVMDRGEGAWVWDVDGNRFLDLAAGIAVCATGHNHPHVVKAVQAQAARFLHMSGTDFYYPEQAQLAERLARVSPGGALTKVFFCNSGAEAVEAAIKLARWFTRRPRFLAFQGAFHGRTMGAISLTASKGIQKERFSPLIPEVVHVPYPDSYRPAFGKAETLVDDLIAYLEERVFSYLEPREFAAVFVEPVQGEGGYIVPPADFLPRLRALTRKYGILLVLDEVQTGFGRTGAMFAAEHTGVVPDIMTLAKGIASGMPLGAILSTPRLMSWPPGAHASTFGGNPVACAAAMATLDLLEDGLIGHSRALGAHMLTRLRAALADHPRVGQVRGLGLMIGIELVRSRRTHTRAPKLRDQLVQRLFRRGLLTLGCGANTLRLCPPLVLTQAEAETALEIIIEEINRL